MLYEELMQGTKIFHPGEDGVGEIEYKPPTSKELRAARAIKDLSERVQQFSSAAQELTLHYQKLLAEYDTMRIKYEKLQEELKKKPEEEIQS